MSDYEIMSLVLQVLILLVSIVTVTGSVIFSILSTKKDYPFRQDKQSFLGNKILQGVIQPSTHLQYNTLIYTMQYNRISQISHMTSMPVQLYICCMIRFYLSHHAKVLDMSDYEIMSLVLQVLILLVSIVTVTGSVLFSTLCNKPDFMIFPICLHTSFCNNFYIHPK